MQMFEIFMKALCFFEEQNIYSTYNVLVNRFFQKNSKDPIMLQPSKIQFVGVLSCCLKVESFLPSIKNNPFEKATFMHNPHLQPHTLTQSNPN